MEGTTVLGPRQLRRARNMRAKGMPWSTIGQTLGRSSETVRAALDPAFRALRRDRIQAWRREHPAPKQEPKRGYTISHWIDVASRERAPAAVLAERDARLNAPLTLNMAILGDPPPGRSALERSPIPQPMRRRADVLDRLIYHV